LIWTPEGLALSPSLWSRATVTSQFWPASSTPPLENCGEVNTGEEGLVQSVWVSSKRRKVGAFRGLVTLECERIRRSCTHLDVDVREVADVGDVAD